MKGTKTVEVKTALIPVTYELRVSAYPNPHTGSLTLSIISPEDGAVRIEWFTTTGQKLAEKEIHAQKDMETIVPFNEMRQGLTLYRIEIGKFVATGKIIGKD